jgi:endonuclease/exonuclease/phosphatase family metal-dependent hydrolase
VPGFPKPRFAYTINVTNERRRLRAHKHVREVPERQAGHLLTATWNIANLGAAEQKRDPECFQLLAEIVQWFDLVAVQEVRDDADAGIRTLLAELPRSWRVVFSETGGNDERLAYLWDSDQVDQGQLIGKVTLEPQELERAGGPGFMGFSRTPYVGTFHRASLQIEIVSIHSYFGDPRDPIDMGKRLAETKAIGWWCEERSEDPHSYTKDIIAVGDFNTPSEDDMELAEAMLADLRRRGLHTPRYERNGEDLLLETQLGTAVRSENHYDHLLFFPRHTDADLVDLGVFDFDAVIFKDLWEDRIARYGEAQGRDDFQRYTIWAVSDHRPLWAQFKAPP